MRETRRWINQSQPQTLQIAVFLLYADAVLALLFGGFLATTGLLVIVGSVAAGYGISNEFKWGYWLGLGIAAFDLFRVLQFLDAGGTVFQIAIPMMIAVARVALLVHPQSRDYQRIWFK